MDRFVGNIAFGAPDACWPYAVLGSDGYGTFSVGTVPDRVSLKAHRVSYEYFTGCTIPPGMKIDHTCSNPPCVNPFHLDVVTDAENSQRAWGRGERKGKAECGHPESEFSLVLHKGKRRPRCRACHRERQRRYSTPERKAQ